MAPASPASCSGCPRHCCRTLPWPRCEAEQRCVPVLGLGRRLSGLACAAASVGRGCTCKSSVLQAGATGNMRARRLPVKRPASAMQDSADDACEDEEPAPASLPSTEAGADVAAARASLQATVERESAEVRLPTTSCSGQGSPQARLSQPAAPCCQTTLCGQAGHLQMPCGACQPRGATPMGLAGLHPLHRSSRLLKRPSRHRRSRLAVCADAGCCARPGWGEPAASRASRRG